jgi:alkylation response protein AidB-like acyl-CoA dehydrogenase
VSESDYGWLEPAQREIVPALRPLLARTWPISRVRELADKGHGFDRDLLASDAGWYLPARPLPETATIAQEWGRALSPAVLVDLNIVVDTLTATGFERPELLAALRRGDRLVAWGGSDLPGHWGRGSGLSLTDDADGLVLNGTVGLVQCAGQADAVLVAAHDGYGVTLLLIPTASTGLTIEPLDGLDLTRELYALSFDGVRVPAEAVVGPRGGAAEQVDRQAQLAVVLSVAATVGSMSVLFEQALADAKTRTAFGRPIGSFQAVKHQLVDGGLVLEISKALSARVAAAVAEGSPDAAEIVSMAKAYVGRAGIDLAHIAWQVLAGKAYMWETDFHLYLRRITADASCYGDVDWHEQRVWEIHSPTGQAAEEK